MLEAAAATSAGTTDDAREAVDGSVYAIVTNWDSVVLDLATHFHIDIHSPEVLARPWPPIRDYIVSLLHTESRLRTALTIRR